MPISDRDKMRSLDPARFGVNSRTPALRRRTFLGILGAASAGGLLSACSTASALSGTKRNGGNLTIVRELDAVSMNKTMVFDNASIWVYVQIYQTLFANTVDGKGVRPWLAESYTSSADKMTWTFKLRPGIKFSNGAPMTSADVKFSIDEASSTHGGWEFINAAIKEVAAPDPLTVVITTKYPWAPLLADLACPSNGIIPNNYGGQSSSKFYTAPIGTGPFMWDTWSVGSALTLKRNPHYWEPGKPSLDSVTWQVVPDTISRALMIQGGQADINEFPAFSSLDELRASSGVEVNVFPSTRTDYILMNENKKPFHDVHVRRAISYAIDRQALIKAVLYGNGRVANSLFMPTVAYYDPKTPGIQYDMAKAKQEMALSSVPNGFTTTYLASSGDTTDAAIAQVLQASLKELGITMNIQNGDPSAVHDMQTSMDYEISHDFWTMDIADPDELVQFALIPSTGGHSFETGLNDPQVISLAEEAERTFDPVRRQQIYSQLQALAAEAAFLGFLFYQPFPYARLSTVQGFYVLPTGAYHLEDVYFTS
jgi:peptide/nickel transport system substrate-binding protein